MRKINLIVVHCSATDNKKYDNVATMDRWHRERGFRKVGYHFYIRKDGTVENGRDISEVGAHAKGHNGMSIGICLGGLKEEKFTQHQFDACARIIRELRKVIDEKLDVVPHRVLSKTKACPVFDMMEIYKRLY